VENGLADEESELHPPDDLGVSVNQLTAHDARKKHDSV
jgi:hypothetical protein